MSVVAITSPGDAPGATTTGFAMALTWPGPVLLAECSPAGGRLLRGYFQCQTPPDQGLWEVALAAVGGVDAALGVLWDQVVPLDTEQRRLLLPGLFDPFLAAELSAATWENLAAMLARLPFTVLADTGPIGPEQPFAVLRAAQLVLVVMRPTLAQVAAARPRIARLRHTLGPGAVLGLCLIGDHPYTVSDIRAELGDFELVLRLPVDSKTAAVLSDGGGSQRLRQRIDATALLRAARTAGRAVIGATTDGQGLCRGLLTGRVTSGTAKPGGGVR